MDPSQELMVLLLKLYPEEAEMREGAVFRAIREKLVARTLQNIRQMIDT